MEFVTSVLNIISLLWKGAAGCTNYSYNLQENLYSLRIAVDELKNVRDDVRRRVNADEARLMIRTHQVDGWLKRVEAMENEVDEILNEGDRQIQRRCLCSCCPRNCLETHELGERVVKRLAVVEELKGKGNFNIVAESFLPASVEALPHNPTMGLDLMFEKTWELLGQDEVGIIGLFGMGGVGKTTLMKNINNEFLKRTHEFDLVIWVTVSKPINVPRIQREIAQRLELSWVDNRKDEDQAKEIFKALVKKKFVLLLDDIWERVDLVGVGIPTPDIQNKSKVVFTTRSKAVCGYMEAHKKIKVECLDWDEAWNLFKNKVGEEAVNSHPEIPKLAQVVAKECGGLPLAIITIGRAMASKTTPEEWKHAITVLKNSASELSGMGDEVFPILKFSYDNLPSDTVRSCFLYCSLYPEDESIDKELIEHWIGEGFIDGFDYMDEARHLGHDIIGILKVTCLLESGYDEESYVKMHDVIRDLAIWVASECGWKKDKYVVKAGLGLRGAPEVGKWSDTERLSLMHNKLDRLKGEPSCPNLLTLLLQSNFRLEKVYVGFFQFMPALRVLNLSYTSIEELPLEITELVELQYLNLSATGIKQLPSGLKNWRKLKYLYLRRTNYLGKIPHGEILMLSSLQALVLHDSSFADWKVEHSDGDQCTPSLGELECLKHLKSLGIAIKTVSVLQRLLNRSELQMCTRYLCIKECQGLTSLTLSPSSPSPSSSSLSTMATAKASLGNMNSLRRLTCDNCVQLEELTINWIVGEEKRGSLCQLESLSLYKLPNLKIIWERSQALLCFENLRRVDISGCDALKDLTWLLHVQSLQDLFLWNCKGIEEIIHGEPTTVELNTFSRLRTIEIRSLPNLKSICGYALLFPSLESIRVYVCPKLNKLPLDSDSAKNTLQWIKGDQKWWDMLEWDDEAIKSIFQDKFQQM